MRHVRFYHGILSERQAEALLEPTPPGTFLVFRKKASSKHFYVKLKWATQEKDKHEEEMNDRLIEHDRENARENDPSLSRAAISSVYYTCMQITLDDCNMYTHANTSTVTATDRTLHGFLSQLPPAAGIDLRKGLRKPQKRWRLHHPYPGSTTSDHVYGIESTNTTDWLATDHPWLHAAHAWDQYGGYIFSAYLAQFVPSHLLFQAMKPNKKHAQVAQKGWAKNDRPYDKANRRGSRLNPNLNQSRHWFGQATTNESRLESTEALVLLLQAKAARGMGKNLESLVLAQQAVALNPAYECIRRSFCRQGHTMPFEPALRHVQKRDRLYEAALAQDTYAPTSRGRPKQEVLLLEALCREGFYPGANLDFYRRLMRAHIRAYCFGGAEEIHVELAMNAIELLFQSWQLDQRQEQLSIFIGQPTLRPLGPSIPSAPWTVPTKRNTTNTPHGYKHTRPNAAQKTHGQKPRFKITRLPWMTWPLAWVAEITEVVYRSLHVPRAIYCLKKITDRLSSLSLCPSYVHLCQISLLRLAFLNATVYGQHRDTDTRLITDNNNNKDDRDNYRKAALAAMSRLCALPIPHLKHVPPIMFPTRMRRPYTNREELLFLRGVVHAMLDQHDAAMADWAPLHTAFVSAMQRTLYEEKIARHTPEYRESHVSSVILTIGQSRHLLGRASDHPSVWNQDRSQTHDNVMLKVPSVSICITCQGQQEWTIEPPTWQTLHDPDWNNQRVRVPVTSAKAMLHIQVMCRDQDPLHHRPPHPRRDKEIHNDHDATEAHMGACTCLGSLAMPVATLFETGLECCDIQMLGGRSVFVLVPV
jgi:hypothetical protein